MSYFCKKKFDDFAKKRFELKNQIASCTDQDKLVVLQKAFDSVENRMVGMCHLIAIRFSRRADYQNYPYEDRQEMIALATLRCWRKLDLYRFGVGLSPLAYFTQAVFSTYSNYLRDYYKKKSREIKIESISNYGDVS